MQGFTGLGVRGFRVKNLGFRVSGDHPETPIPRR